ncbi:CD209 antigen-like protein E isoform X2 [Etheostoma cragini]|uniref:CD209 antigen-like protein E isoform X2 n=1 Tax=Etheostoma cragini TaxID=417921 RepID=UPI00155F3B6C|nr:CD209 antigen-like protein E isoform X2 [Etheostoma cragini]
MAKFVHGEQSEITVDYVNQPDASARSSGQDRRVTAAVPGRKLHRLVAVSFGLLCVLQSALNISLRLYNKTEDIEVCCTNLTSEQKRELLNFDHYFKQGWVYFRLSFYYISSEKKSWQDSRADCQQRSADLVIINSKEEQDFTSTFHKLTWIGLTERETKGTWKWVDGTLLTKSYWNPGEPNDYEGKNEDCVEIRTHDWENNWNDLPCGHQNFWICEKRIAL